MSILTKRLSAVLFALAALLWLSPSQAQAPSNRIALVIGNGAYQVQPLKTAPNDAGLVAQTLTAAGFEVSGARDLDSDAIRKAFRDFLERAAQLGPDGIAFVYLAGYGAQFQGDNYFVPVDAKLGRDSDVPIQAIRLSDLTRALAGIPMQGRVVVLDAAYRNPFPAAGSLAGGLALVEPEAGSLLAFNAAPGTLGPATSEAYGVYGQALAEMLRQGGIPVQEVFDRVRLRVNELTKGADVPWSSSKLTGSFVFLQRAPDAPPPSGPQITYEDMQRRPLREFSAPEAYTAAVARDTFQGYQDFVTAFPTSPYVTRVRGLLAARREALSWRHTTAVNTPPAYWSYLRRYPRGPHSGEARYRLRELSVALAPPPDFAPIDYDVPPPPQDEYRYVDAPVIVFDEPDYGPPPPPPPVYFLPPQPEESVYNLPPPPPPVGIGFLPIPIPIPIPYARAPSAPGRLQPLQGYQGSYAQPQPFYQAPRGGLAPQPGTVPPLPPPGGQQRPLPPGPTPVAPGPLPPGTPAGVIPQAQQLMQQRQLQLQQQQGQRPPAQPLLPQQPQVLPPHGAPIQQLPPGVQPNAQQLIQQRQQQLQQQGVPGQPPSPAQTLPQAQQLQQLRQQQLQQQHQQGDQQRQQQLQQLQERQQEQVQQRQQQLQQRQQEQVQQRQQQLQQHQQEQVQQRQQQLQQHQQEQVQQRQQQLQQRQQEQVQQRQQQLQQHQQEQMQQRQQQLQQHQQEQVQQRQQQMQQHQQEQIQQQRQQMQQHQQEQIQQQRQQMQQHQQEQMQQQRQQMQQHQQEQMQQQRQQMQQHQQEQIQQQRQQMQQHQQEQMQQQRQQMQQHQQEQMQQQRQQMQHPPQAPGGRPQIPPGLCGKPGMPPCP